MTMFGKRLAGILAAASVFAAIPVFAAPPAPPSSEDAGPPDGGPGGHFRERMYEKLGLSADQKSKVDAIFDSQGASMKQLHEQIRGNMERLHSIKPNDPNYGATVAEVSQSNGALTSQVITAEADIRSKVYAVLTPAQQTQLDAMEAKMRDHAKDGRHWRHGPPAPPSGG